MCAGEAGGAGFVVAVSAGDAVGWDRRIADIAASLRARRAGKSIDIVATLTLRAVRGRSAENAARKGTLTDRTGIRNQVVPTCAVETY